MNAPLLPVRFGSIPTAAGLAKALADHACVSVVGAADATNVALLDQTERELSSLRYRCVRIRGPLSGDLALRDLIAQVVGRPSAAGLTDHDLKAGFVALTEPGEDYSLVALLVSEAHNLLPSAVRYIQLACQSGPRLRVVLAGQPGLAATLAQDEFAPLRHMTYALELCDTAGRLPLGSGLAMPEPLPVPRPNGSSALVRLGLAALLVPMVGLIWWRHLPPSPAIETPVSLPIPNTPAAQLAVATPVAKEPERIDEIFPPEPEPEASPAPVVAVAPMPASADAPAEPAPAAPEAIAEVAVPEPPTVPAEPTESSAIVSAEPPVAAAPERMVETTQEPQAPAEAALPVPETGPTLAQATEPAVQVPDTAPPLPETTDAAGSAADAGPPAPPLPSLPAALSLPPIVSPPVHQRARPETPRPAVAVAVPPTRLADERRCRDIVLKAQLGKDPSDTDKRFLRSGCRAE